MNIGNDPVRQCLVGSGREVPANYFVSAVLHRQVRYHD